MYLRRKLDSVLTDWYSARSRKPLVLRGARQTGKSTSVREFGKAAPAFVELNLERAEDRRLIESCQGPEDLLQSLLVRHNLPAFPAGTLLFLDEVQAAARVIGWLRFLHEDHPGLAVVAAGSLLEVRMAEQGFSFPVGRVTFRTIRPLSFLEFARAVGKDVLADRVAESVVRPERLAPAVHEQAMALLRDYLLVGGMPEAVVLWCEHRALPPVRQVHSDLRQAFAEDIQKYGGQPSSIERVFNHMAGAYGRRFKYENFAPGMPSRIAHSALDKLEGAEIVRRALPTDSTRTPIREKARSAPKLLPLDIGMALSELGAPPEAVRSSSLVEFLDGRAAECFVGQQLLCTRDCSPVPLHFWVRESAAGAAETDYLVQSRAGVLPIEVKSGKAGSLKSLHQFMWRSRGKLGLRLNAAPPVDAQCEVRMPDGLLRFRLLSLPMYCAELVRELPATAA